MTALQANFTKNILQHFPKIRFGISYGSGAIPQKGYDYSDPTKRPMVDFIFAVDDPVKWHEENLARNKTHYSLLAAGGPNFVAKVQDEFGANIYYNTHVQVEGQKIKYGIISHKLLCRDLTEWTTFYVSGRMQKPVLVVQEDNVVSTCNKTNLKNALCASLLLLPEVFSESDLYEKIASLSYLGDVRMKLAENPRKVHNMVSRNMEPFHNLYWDTIAENAHYFSDIPSKSGENFVVKKNAETKLQLLQQMPAKVQDSFGENYGKNRTGTTRELLEEIISTQQERSAIELGISSIVNVYSQKQTLKGIFTAGVVKSVQYAINKVKSSKK